MPINPNLDINYTPVQKTAIDGGMATAKTNLDAAVGPPLNLSTAERQSTPSVDAQREPFVRDAIESLSIQFPNLISPEITLVRAAALWAFRNSSLDILAQIDALRDKLIDATINAENICLKFTEDMRDKAERYKDRNVEGADTAWQRLKGLHTVTTNPVTPP
jgi:hypothetical protein